MKKLKKLQLNRETLLSLEKLGTVQGGGSVGCSNNTCGPYGGSECNAE